MIPDGEHPSVVIDHGSDRFRAGLAGENAPSRIFPAVVGIPKNPNWMAGMTQQVSHYCGDDAMSKRGILKLSYPYRKGIINDWDNMEKLWHYTFYNELRVDPSDQRLLMTDTICSPHSQKERLCEVMFEVYTPFSMSVVNRLEHACYAQGLTSAFCAMLGHSGVFAAAVSDGLLVQSTAGTSDVGGESLTLHLRNLMDRRGFCFTTSAEMAIVADFKRHCEVAEDYEDILQQYREGNGPAKFYELPDGQEIDLNDAVYNCPEVLFKPELASLSQASLPALVARSLGKCTEATRRTLNNRCLLFGGSAMFPGVGNRLRTELKQFLGEKHPLQVSVSPNAEYDSWIGGSIIASLSTFATISLTRQEYDEQGAIRILSKGK